MTRWKYASLRYFRATYPGVMTVGSGEKATLRFMIYGQEDSFREYQPEQLSEVIAWLGDNGWEMVNATYHNQYIRSEGYIDEWQRFYFKRPVEE